MIEIAFLGNGGMMPTATRWLSSTLLRIERQLILLDCGEGAQIPWRSTGWGFKRLSQICISHSHADHVAGLPGLLHAVALAGRTEPVTIIGPRGTRNIVAGIKELAPVMPYDLVVADLANGQSWESGGVTIDVGAGDHRVQVLVFRLSVSRKPEFLVDSAVAAAVPRVDWRTLANGIDTKDWRAADFLGPPRKGLSVGYMTDTRPTPSALHALTEVDLLIAEGTYGDDADQANAALHKHMTFREAATFAREANAKRLVLTHFSPKMEEPEVWLENATSVFPASQIADPARRIMLRYQDD